MLKLTITIISLLLVLEPGNFVQGATLLGELEDLLEGESTANIFITLSSGPEELLERLASQTFGNRLDRVTSVVESLKQHSNRTQQVVMDVLQKFSSVSPMPLEIKPFWISNQIYVKGANKFLVLMLQALGPLISFIGAEKFADLIPTIPSEPVKATGTTNSNITWGLEKIGIDEAWRQLSGVNSNPVIVGSIDSGVRVTHEALKNNFVGAYGWYDPVEETPTPNDQNGHGTHTTGIIPT